MTTKPVVYVLRLDYMILGVLGDRQRALAESALMRDALGGSWVDVSAMKNGLCWRSALGRYLDIDIHEVN